MKSIIIFVTILLFFVNNIYAQTGTFNFETATASGSPLHVSQTVDSRTITISSSVDFNAVDPFIEWAFTVNGISGKTAINDISMTQTITISFSGSVNITTLKVYEGTASNSPGTMTFVPTGGSNSTVNFTPSPNQWDDNSKLVTLNWVGITAINITAPYTYYWGFDDIIMNAALPVELTSFTATTKFNQVSLNWQTANEVNNYGFEIERMSSQNTNWDEIGFVKGHGNSSSPKVYSFKDTPDGGGKFKYRLKQIDTDGKYQYSNEVEAVLEIPTGFSVKQNFPNPFNPTTKIEFSISSDNNVEVNVFNVLGLKVATLMNEYVQAGTHTVEFDASNLSSGIYFYKIVCGNNSEMKKMILLR